MELELTRVAGDLQNLIDTANAPIFGIDTDGRVNQWNQHTAELLSRPKHEVMGTKLVEEYIAEEYRPAVQEVLDNALAGKPTANFDFPLFGKDGERIDILLNATSRTDREGTVA